MDINTFISENYTAIIIIAVILVMTIIGYFAQKTEFGKKVSKYNKKSEELDLKEKNEKMEILDENFVNDSNTNKGEEIEQLDVLDTIAPNFNDGGLIIGDVNQNPSQTNEDLGIPDDLYAPFGDSNINVVPSIDELKIEEVSETDDFNIIEKDNIKNNDDTDESVIKDINESLKPGNDFDVESLEIEDVKTSEDKNIETPQTNVPDTIAEEISDLVDNTFVINDGTDDFENSGISQEISTDQEKIEEKNIDSKVEKFNIDENAILTEEPNDLEIESTTNLKLDEINEKIKNLKLEDLDNTGFEEELVNNFKKSKKKEQISVKSVDEIRKKSNKKNGQKKEDIIEMNLPDLDMISGNNKDVNEADDTWDF